MAITPMVEISGQGGNVSIGGVEFGVTRWMLRKQFHNADTTDTACGGWAQKRILAGWSFVAEIIVNKDRILDGTTALAGLIVPDGIDSPIPLACIFAVGNSLKTYRGYGLLETNAPTNDSGDVVKVQIAGTGTGSLVGPT